MPDVTVELGVNEVEVNISVVEAVVSVEGVPGPPGTGSIDSDKFFQVDLKFAELNTPQKKIDARTNLELQDIDCGVFL